MPSRDRAPCIVGVGQTHYTKRGALSGVSEFALACQAVLNAAKDAGISAAQIEGFTSFGSDYNEPARVQAALGIPQMNFCSLVWGGGGGGSCASVAHAAMAVESGEASFVAVYRSLCQGQSRRYGQINAARPLGSFNLPFGLVAPPQLLALVAKRHMHEFGTTREQFGRIAVAARSNARRNPASVMREPLTLSEYLSARMIADPFGLYDCCLETDGACALIVTTWERALDLAKQPVRVLSMAMGGGQWNLGPLGSHDQPADQYASTGAQSVARRLYNRAGVSPSDIKVAQIYDNFTALALMSLEDFGFCERGEGGAFVAEGNIDWPAGRVPINTHGGALSEAYVHGLNHVIEGVRQIRAESTCQVEDADLCLVTGGPGPSPTSALILATP